MITIYLISGLIIGLLIGYYIALNHNKIVQREIDNKYYQEKESLERSIKCLQSDCNLLSNDKIRIRDELIAEEDKLRQHYQVMLDQEKNRYETELTHLENYFEQEKETYTLDYLDVLVNYRKEFAALTENKQQELQEIVNLIEEKIKDLAQIELQINAAVESNKRAELERTEKDFYRLNISKQDIEEIKKIRSIEPYLRDKEALNKVVWKVYYEKAYTDLIGRVIGANKKITGIYKITNLENNMCYVGQSVNIAERFKQHIKRGIGAETPTRNKLYPAMMEIGVENFMFEVLEECSADLLDKEERFFQDLYHAREFGYSIL